MRRTAFMTILSLLASAPPPVIHMPTVVAEIAISVLFVPPRGFVYMSAAEIEEEL